MPNEVRGFSDTIAWYDANAEKYAINIESFPSGDLLDRFAKAVGRGGKVLDAGCAAGRDCGLLKDRGLVPAGIDLSEPLIEIARNKHPDIEFRQGNILNLPFEDESFDGVWAHASLVHFETTEEVVKALREFNRVLKPDGVIHVFVKQQLGDEKTSVVSDKLSGHDRFFQWFTGDEV
jgi:ubiquinone/menaquinone biosynthesis C-methylase UbiE